VLYNRLGKIEGDIDGTGAIFTHWFCLPIFPNGKIEGSVYSLVMHLGHPMNDHPKAMLTYAALRMEHDAVEPQQVTALLGLSPTQTVRLTSKDSLAHIQWLLAAIGSRGSELRRLREEGHGMKIYCLWLAGKGYAGPMLTPNVMRGLADLGLELWFDIGFDGTQDFKGLTDA
jgi:hypothetical protein